MVVWSSTKTLQKVGEFDTGITGGNGLAGIVVNTKQDLIYVMSREFTYLHLYTFNESVNTLVLESSWYLNPTPGHPPIYGMGLALDEDRNLLYVTSNGSNRVHIYDTDDFIGSGGDVDPNGYIDIVVGETPREAIGIAVDPARGYLYTGNFYGTGYNHTSLVRTPTEPPYTSIETDIGYPVIGIDVDKSTGLVYCTTHAYYGQYTSDFRVYNSSLTLLDIERNSGIESPAGVAVGGWYKSAVFGLTKNDNVDCVYPYNSYDQNYLVYEICYDANDHNDTNVVITDYLPPEVNYYSSNPVGTYHSDTKTVTWNIYNQSGCIQLTVMVNNYAKPGGIITNVVEIEGDNYYRKVIEDTNVCCYGGNIIYVDWDANGFNNGTSWDDAYNDLQDALTTAKNCGASVTAIWVAAGTYKPTQNPADNDANFALIEDVALFGHFPPEGSYRSGPENRNFADANNETILEGQIGTQSEQAVRYVVTSNGIKNALVDGFTVTGSYSDYEGAGIFLNDSNTAIVNCKIKNNHKFGAYITNFSYPDIHNCLFINNSTVGIKCDGSSPTITDTIFDGNNTTFGGVAGYNISVITLSNCTAKNHIESGIYGNQTDIEVENCCVTDNGFGIYCEYYSNATINISLIKNNNAQGLWCAADSSLDLLTNSIIRWNGYDGIHLEDGRSATIKNNWIHNNYYGCGIYLKGQHSQPIITNNTICDNFTYGIHHVSLGIEPVVTNCIVWSNGTANLFKEGGGTLEHVTYSSIGGGYLGEGNISIGPGFMNPDDPNDFHIAENSPCKDTGDPNVNYDNQTDIDGEDRVKYGRVDMGGDEYYLSLADFDSDGIVNFIDYAEFAKAWQTQNQNPSRSLDGDSDVDIYDLKLFCDDWLWEAGWTKTFDCGCSAGEGVTTGLQTMAIESAYSFEGAPAVKTTDSERLMLLNTDTSLAAMPERLAIKAEKFYAVTAAPQETRPVEITPLKIKELIKWLEEIWLDEEAQKLIDKAVLLKFIESLKEEL